MQLLSAAAEAVVIIQVMVAAEVAQADFFKVGYLLELQCLALSAQAAQVVPVAVQAPSVE
jgi:hypothetical protein